MFHLQNLEPTLIPSEEFAKIEKQQAGSLKIPASEWTSFKKRIYSQYNSAVNRDYQIALQIYSFLKEDSKAIRKYPYRKSFSLKIQEYNLFWDSVQRIEDSLFPSTETPSKLFKPKKKNFSLSTNQTKILVITNAQIEFCNITKTFFWTTVSGSDTIEEAHNHPLAQTIFSFLETIPWKRNSGGIIIDYEYEGMKFKDETIAYSFGPVGNKLSKNTNRN